MRYFVPDLRLPEESEEGAERLGGLPFGLAARDWPVCGECGKPQSLLAQLAHHPKRLDLGRDGRTLLVFQCGNDPGMCDTWDAASGANACIVAEHGQLSRHESTLPPDSPPSDNAVIIAGWIARDDGVSEGDAASFYEDAKYFALDESILERVTTGMRLGGVPSWIQSPDEAPRGWRFIGQLDSGYSFLHPPQEARSWISPDPGAWEGRTHYGEGPNFGGGIAYLFLRDGNPRPEVRMFWQCS